MLRSHISRRLWASRGLRCSLVRADAPKVTPDELSQALRGRLRLNEADLKNADELDVPRPVSSRYTKALDATLPVSGKSFVAKTRPRFDPKAKLFVKRIANTADLQQITAPDKLKVPRLAHNLEKALAKKGVHFMFERESQQYQFVESLDRIDQLEQFGDFSRFVSPSKDKTLLQLAVQHNKKYYSSTSSMTSTLMQFYLLMNNYDPDVDKRFRFVFTKLVSTLPTSFVVRRQSDGVFSVESDKSVDIETFLGKFGHVSEVLLTNEHEDIQLYKQQQSQIDSQDIDLLKDLGSELRNERLIPHIFKDESELQKYLDFTNPTNVYNVAAYDKFLMRSQLDCYSDKLPGNGTFDLKSRAISSIRYNLADPDVATREHPRRFFYKSEFDDLVRTGALLKYSFQARIGQMDGIFVAYHNISSFLGFEYLTLEDIDRIYFNRSPLASYIADSRFKFSIRVWSDLLDLIIEDLTKSGDFDSFRVVLRSQKKPGVPFHALTAHVVPLTADECTELQTFGDRLELPADFDQRSAKLYEHQSALEDLNKRLVGKSGVLTYTVETSDWVNGAKLTSHELPKTRDKWIMDYRIGRESPNVDEYLKEVNLLGQVITWAIKRTKPQTPEANGPENPPAEEPAPTASASTPVSAKISAVQKIVGKPKTSKKRRPVNRNI